MDLKKATKILNNLVMYCRFNEEKKYTDEQLFNAIEYFAFNKFIPVKKIENEIEILKAQCGGNVFHIQQTLNAEIRLLEELLENK